jgi:hypothetical protein
MSGVGKHSGHGDPARVGPAPAKRVRVGQDKPRQKSANALGHLVALVLAMLATIAAWGALVWLAITFGTMARDGQASAWLFMGLAGLGAATCLFLGLMIIMRLAVAAQGLRSVAHVESELPARSTPSKGGKRAAR